MYFDTLKVSSLEQTAEDTSARGGIGNPNLITWNFGKEITVSLEDALYTPASQSLMWGGKFGLNKTRVKGFWNPIYYRKDSTGQVDYINKTDITETINQKYLEYVDYIYDMINDADVIDGNLGLAIAHYYQEIGALDNVFSMAEQGMTKEDIINEVNKGTEINFIIGLSEGVVGIDKTFFTKDVIKKTTQLLYKATPKTMGYEQNDYITYICPCTNERKFFTIQPTSFVYKYTDEFLGYSNDKIAIIYGYKENEDEEPVKYSCDLFLPTPPKNGQPAEKANLIINNFGSFKFSEKKIGSLNNGRYLLTTLNNTDTSSCLPWQAPFSYINTDNDVLFDYEWLDCDVQMVSQQGDQDIYYAEHVDVLVRADSEGFNKKILIKYHNDSSYYNSQIDFYKIVKYSMGNTIITAKIKVGTFYINDDFNYNTVVQDSIYSIEDGIEDVHYLDRMEKCIAKQTFCINTDQNTVLNYYKDLPQYKQSKLTVYIDPRTMKAYEPNADSFQKKNGVIVNGNLRIIKQHEVYYKWTRSEAPENTTLGHQIIVDAKHFPGTFRLVGETLSRRRKDGKDERYQFEIPLCKLAPDTNLTLQADGDPTTFSMNLKVLQRSDGVMMKLTQYDVEPAIYNGQISGSNKIIPSAAEYNGNSCITCENPEIRISASGGTEYEIILPYQDSYYCVPIDCLYPFTEGQAYLMLPKTLDDAYEINDTYQHALETGDYSELEKYRNILLVRAQGGGTAIFINNQLYKVIDGNVNPDGTFIIESAQGVNFTIALGGGD